jgi:preprotein translocase subunit SecE
MGEKAPKKSWSEGLKSEFNKIVWPDKKSLGKQTGAVVVVSVILGVIITVVDFLVQYGVNLIAK